jgi:hypothetical protein
VAWPSWADSLHRLAYALDPVSQNRETAMKASASLYALGRQNDEQPEA